MIAVLSGRRGRMRNNADAVREFLSGVDFFRVTWTVFVIVVLVAGILGFRHWLYSPNVWPVNEVRVSGTFLFVRQSEIANAVSELRGQNLFACDLEYVKSQIKRHPWVDSVSVRRQWPGVVSVEINEQRPFAKWSSGGLVNERGERFAAPPDTQPAQLPLFSGPNGSEREVLARFRDLTAAIAPVGLTLSQLAVDSRGAWRATLSNGLDVIVGRRIDERRIARFVSAYPRVVGPAVDHIERVDLRYPNGFAVRWRPDENAVK